MKGFKTIVFFGAVAILGLITTIQAEDIQSILLPALCLVDPNADFVADECTGKVVALTGKIMLALGGIGGFLRFITTSAIFKPQ